MKRPQSHVIADEAIAILKGALPSHWICRTIEKDYGIDLEVELVESGDVTGARVWFQVKGTTCLKSVRRAPLSATAGHGSIPARLPKECISFPVETKLLKYALRCDFPVLLAVVDVKDKDVYWLPLRDYIEMALDHQMPRWDEQRTISLLMPLENSFAKERECDWKGLRWYALEMARTRAFVILDINHKFATWECEAIEKIAQSPEEPSIDMRILTRAIYTARAYLARTLATECLFGPRGVDFVEIMHEGQLSAGVKASETALTLLAKGCFDYKRLRVLMCAIAHGIMSMEGCVLSYQAMRRRFLFSDERSLSFKKKS
jgi:hypothetical protein